MIIVGDLLKKNGARVSLMFRLHFVFEFNTKHCTIKRGDIYNLDGDANQSQIHIIPPLYIITLREKSFSALEKNFD
jgi:hypothetical protein